MDFIKNEIHTCKLEKVKKSQIMIDDDFNIPEAKEDVEKIVAKKGQLEVEQVIASDNKIRVIGTVRFEILYISKDEGELECYEGKMNFEDMVSFEEYAGCQADVKSNLSELSVSIINSRKLEARALIATNVCIYRQETIAGTSGISNGQGIECLTSRKTFTRLAVGTRDMMRVREDIDIPQNKPNIDKIMWENVTLHDMEAKAADGKIMVRGCIEAFIIYSATEEHIPLQYILTRRNIQREITCQGASEGMVAAVDFELGKSGITVKNDVDSEPRVFALDAEIDLDVKLYEDVELTLLEDVYSANSVLKPQVLEFTNENLLVRNCAKAKVSRRIKISEGSEKLLQVCYSFGSVDVLNVTKSGENITLEGVVRGTVIYIPTGDEPLCSYDMDIPFSYEAQTGIDSENVSVRVIPCLDSINTELQSSEEIEVKAQINMSISVFEDKCGSVVTDMEVLPLDLDKKAEMPGIIGYIVKDKDTIWSVAREFFADMDTIRSVNGLESDELHPGDRLLIVK